jgi:hypothetical protein
VVLQKGPSRFGLKYHIHHVICQISTDQGKYRSVPTFVFFDENFRELGRWIERPASGNAIAREIQELADRQNLTEPQMREIRSKKMNEEYATLSAEFIKEIKELLSR